MNKKIMFRYFVLGFFLMLFSYYSIRHFVLGGGEAASVHALCPFGGFESLYTFIFTGSLVPEIMASSFVLAIGFILVSIVFRRGFCGWICPFGTVQELLGKITKKKIRIPFKIDKFLRSFKYIILAVILIGTAYTGTLVFRGYDPFMTFFHFGKGILWDYNSGEILEHITGFLIMIVVLVLAVFVNRAWCRYFCPLGAISSILSKFSFFRIKRDKDKCIDCKICDRKCPMNIKVSKISKVNNHECIDCQSCIDSCPKNALSETFFNKNVKSYYYVIGLILLFFLPVIFAKGFGLWESVPVIYDSTKQGESITSEEIKGWMSLSYVSSASGIDVSHFIRDFNLPENIDITIPIKDISKVYSIEFHAGDLKEYVDGFEHCEEDEEETDATCPWGMEYDTTRHCGLWEDKDDNGICDLSE